MNTPLDINELRRLLDRWYAGTATPAETAALESRLADGADVPDDLEADARLFRDIARSRDAEAEAPADLNERILAATVGSRQSRFHWPRLAAAAAVALLIMAAVAMLIVPKPQAIESETFATASDDPYIELTDSAEVAETTMLALAQIDRSMRHAARGIARAEEIINN